MTPIAPAPHIASRIQLPPPPSGGKPAGPSMTDVMRERAQPSPRIADMSQLSTALYKVANEAQRGPLSGGQMEGAVRVMTDGVRLLSRARDSVDHGLVARAFNPGSGVNPHDVARSIDLAHEQIVAVKQAAEAVQPTERLLRKDTFTLDPTIVTSIRSTAATVRQAEQGAALLSGPNRYRLNFADGDVLDIPKDATVEARKDPDLARAMDRRFLPIQRPIKNLGRVAGVIMKGGVEVIGADKIPENGPFIIAPTHATMSDGPVWLSFIGKQTGAQVRPMMKSGIGPIGGILERVLATGGVFTVDTGSTTGDRSLAAAREMLQKGQAVVIYPEGRLVKNDLVGQNRDGIARLALDTNVKVIPVAVYGTKNEQIHGQKGRGVTMVVGDPIDPSGAPNSHHNVGVVRDSLQKSLVTMYDQASDRWRQRQVERSGITHDEALALAQ